ncbi:hypothetical protein [Lacipirellula parvula]|uniref:Uncharacterized protein n=1 Tax=Lacipirellula parvula TaxID=2650471 RepID=A0A5K7XH02_9BACT|nr:hypothetical protein [Lacipirellula parvula]BBO32239.1 hypothetical protein PLANPX_1851 [Lacipirellula parvula]
MRLRSSLIKVSDLVACDRDAMFGLMQRAYANIQRKQFEADLAAKEWVVQVHDPLSERLAGFSTQTLLQAEVDGKLVRALFSGDTVVDPQHWGDIALAHEWGRLAVSLIESHAEQPLYWFLTSKGFRTYKYLPLFFREWFPSADAPTPSRERAVIDALAREVAPLGYDANTQLIRAMPDKEYVRATLADPGHRAQSDRHVRYFIARNPGYQRGDELCCVAPLSKANFTAAALRVIYPAASVPLAG